MDELPTPVTPENTPQTDDHLSEPRHVDSSVSSTDKTGKTARAIQRLRSNQHLGPVFRTLATRSFYWPTVVIFSCLIVGFGVAGLRGKPEDIWLQLSSLFVILETVYLLAIVPCFRTKFLQKHIFWFIVLLVVSVLFAVAALVFWGLHHFDSVLPLFLAAGFCQNIAVAQFTDGVANETEPNSSGNEDEHDDNESHRMSTFSRHDIHNIWGIHTPNTVRTADASLTSMLLMLPLPLVSPRISMQRLWRSVVPISEPSNSILMLDLISETQNLV